MLGKKYTNSLDDMGTYISGLGQHAELRTPVIQQLQLHSCSNFQQDVASVFHVAPLMHDVT